MIEYFSSFGYVGIFAAIILTGFGLPMPEELPVLFSGVLCGHADTLYPGMTELDPHRLRWWVMVPVVIAAIVTGDGLLYAVGRRWGYRLFENGWVKRWIIKPDTRTTIEKNFQERGIVVLLTARLTPGIRTPVFLMAGHYRVPFAHFVLADALYAVPGVCVMFGLSYWLTDQVLVVFHKIEHYKQAAVLIILSAVGGVVLYRLFVNRHVATGSPKDVPMLVKPVGTVTAAVEQAVEKAAAKAYDVVVHRGHHEAKPPEGAKPPDAAEEVKALPFVLPGTVADRPAAPPVNGTPRAPSDDQTAEAPKLPRPTAYPE